MSVRVDPTLRRRSALLALVVLAAMLALSLAPTPARAGGPAISGAGSNWVQIALDQWRADAARDGLDINYQGVGSSAGRQFYIIGQVDFAATEIPFLPSELEQLKGQDKSFQYVPDVAGGTALMYNVKDLSGNQVEDLRLSAPTIAGIFAGSITNWTDAAIKKENPGLRLPNLRITPVVRSDGSGTSAKLADYLAAKASSTWNSFAASHDVTMPLQFWPEFPGSVAVRGSDGVANYVSNPSVGKGAIGYVEAGYAYEHSLTPAYILNASGTYAAPSSINVSVALKHATLNSDLTQNLQGVYDAPEKEAYPLASYSYLITPTANFDTAKGKVLGQWMIYIACAGQQRAAPLGYSPLPPNLVEAVFSAVRRIPGAPTPPKADAAHCKNPTITGEGYGGGPQGDTSEATAGTTTTTASGAKASSSGSGASSGSAAGASGGDGGSGDTAGADDGGAASTGSAEGDAQAAALLQAGGAGAAGLDVKVLSDQERADGFDAALASIRSDRTGGSSSQVALALLALVLVGPLVLHESRRRRARRGIVQTPAGPVPSEVATTPVSPPAAEVSR